ncbi:MAG: methyl-accepting chemotaxis protein [Candidatus Wallbacteria bacterium]
MLRKKLFIKKEFQWQIILIIILSVFIFANITFSLMLIYISYMFENESLSNLLTDGNLYYKLLPVLALIELTGIIIIFYLSLYISHIMAGPIYRLEKLVALMGDGDFSFDVQTRKNDEFKELTTRLDTMSKKIKAKIYNLKTASEGIKNSLQNFAFFFSGNNSKSTDESMSRNFNSLLTLTEELENQLNEFKLEMPEKSEVQTSVGNDDSITNKNLKAEK